MKFTHLHLHTQYSLLDGAIRLQPLFDKCKEYKQDSVAITDHGTLFGAMHFWDLARKNDIKPIIGAEVYITTGSRFDRGKNLSIHDSSRLHHLILLVENRKGYENLCRLITAGYHEGFYYKPRIDHGILKEMNEDLICMSACLAGEVPWNIKNGKIEEAWEAAKWHRDVFGDRYYLEIQSNSIPEQAVANNEIIKIAGDLNIPLVATNDCHYLEKKDVRAHEILLCIQTQTTISDQNRFKLSSDDFYFRSTEEMISLFRDTPEAIENTQVISERCCFDFPEKTFLLPNIKTPDDENIEVYFRRRALEGFNERWETILKKLKSEDKSDREIEETKASYLERLEYELKIITGMKFPGYFLIVSDFINHAKEKSIPVGPGRGSGAGSLVAYSLKITEIDPIPYGLLFERFLNPDRLDMPDFDVDFCQDRRDEVIEYVTNKYGKDKVAMIITYGSLKARGVIRDVARAFEVPYSEADQIAKLVPETLNITLQEAMEQEPKIKEIVKKDPKINDVIDVSLSLEGLYKSAGMHAAGVIISDKPLINHLPLFKGKKGEPVTMFDMKYVGELGLIKFDFLGLKNLSVIKKSEVMIKKINSDFKISLIPLDDKNTYELYKRGDTSGVFQVESSGMKDLLTKLKPTNFEDIIALVALYRPGPLGSGMVDDFIARKHGRAKITYPFPELEKILKDTYGVIVYQEQVMQIASALAGFTPGEADILRKAMGKKKADVMKEQKNKFLKGSNDRGHDIQRAESLFDLMEKFGEYGFNKSHATCYALISYQTAYLKANYPHEFYASLLSFEMDNTDKITIYIADARAANIEVLPPDVNESDLYFTVVKNGEEKSIRFGLGAIKNVGETALELILSERNKNSKYLNLQDILTRIDTGKANKRIFENLIKAGALDFDGHNRNTLLSNLEPLLQFVQAIKEDREVGQVTLFDVLSQNEGSSSSDFQWQTHNEWDDKTKLQFEKEALGFYTSGHPLEKYLKVLEEYATYKSSDSEKAVYERREVIAGGVISTIKEIRTKKGKKMAFVTLEDLDGSIEFIVFPEPYETYHDIIYGDEPVFIRGTLENSENGVKILVSMPKFDTGNMENNDKPLFQQMKDVKFQESQTLSLNIKLTDAIEENIRRLKYIINSHRGTARVIVNININGSATTTLKLPEHYRVNPSTAFLNKIENLFGKGIANLN